MGKPGFFLPVFCIVLIQKAAGNLRFKDRKVKRYKAHMTKFKEMLSKIKIKKLKNPIK